MPIPCFQDPGRSGSRGRTRSINGAAKDHADNRNNLLCFPWHDFQALMLLRFCRLLLFLRAQVRVPRGLHGAVGASRRPSHLTQCDTSRPMVVTERYYKTHRVSRFRPGMVPGTPKSGITRHCGRFLNPWVVTVKNPSGTRQISAHRKTPAPCPVGVGTSQIHTLSYALKPKRDPQKDTSSHFEIAHF